MQFGNFCGRNLEQALLLLQTNGVLGLALEQCKAVLVLDLELEH